MRKRIAIGLLPVALLGIVGAAVWAARAPDSVPRSYLPVVFDSFEPLPDLTVGTVEIELETGGACDYTSTNLGLRVFVRNIGLADAGPFVVDANGNRRDVGGLAAGAMTDVWFAQYAWPGPNRVYVDVDSQVREGNEDNNAFEGMVPIPTLPPTCTPTPTPQFTPTPTPTPTRPPRG